MKDMAETFRWNPAGENPARQSLASSRKRVLRGRRVTLAVRSVDSECEGRVIEPRNAYTSREPSLLSMAEGRVGPCRNGLAWSVPPGSRERAHAHRVPQEPGRSCRLHRRQSGRDTGSPTSCTCGGVAIRRPPGAKASRDADGTAERRQRSAAGRAAGVGAPHSTDEAGEPTRRDPAEGRGRRVMEPLEGKMAGTPSPGSDLNATTADSGTGEAIAADGVHDAGPPHRHRLAARGVPAHAQGRGGGRGRTDGARTTQTNLEGNLRSLLDRAKSGTYRAPPVRRVHIPKGTGSETRPIGIPTFEDKVLQRAVAMVLEPSTSRTSWTARTASGRAARRTRRWRRSGTQLMEHGGRLGPGGRHPEVLRHSGPRPPARLLRQRVRDGVLLRLIGKWLNAGVLEDGSADAPGSRHAPGRGDLTPAGQRLPARGAGHVVRADGQAAPEGAGVPDPLRGRLRDRSSSRRRTRDGCWRCCRSDSGSTA